MANKIKDYTYSHDYEKVIDPKNGKEVLVDVQDASIHFKIGRGKTVKAVRHCSFKIYKGETLYSITGTPPSLFNVIKGDAFAPRNPFALEIDFVKEPPMFQITDTHFAKTWLLDPRAPKVERPAVIGEISERVKRIYGGVINNGK